MKINIENCINQTISCIKQDVGGYKYTMREFIHNLKCLKETHEKGRGDDGLNEFFKLYVFNEDQNKGKISN